MNRRDLIASGAAAAASTPALGGVPVAEGVDPAVEAVRRWAQLLSATNAHAAAVGDSVVDLCDCPRYRELNAATDAAFRELIETRPTTLAGMAALTRVYAAQGKLADAGSRFEDLDSWRFWPEWADAREHALLKAILAAGGQGAVRETGHEGRRNRDGLPGRPHPAGDRGAHLPRPGRD